MNITFFQEGDWLDEITINKPLHEIEDALNDLYTRKLEKDAKAVDSDLLDGFDQTAFGKLDSARTWSAKQTFDGHIDVENIYNSTPVQIMNGSNAQKIHTGGVLVSDNYSDTNKVPTNGIYSKGGITTDGPIAAQYAGEPGDGVHVVSPDGAFYSTSESTTTGYLKITLPQSWSNTMLKFRISIFDYAGDADGESVTMELGGYNYGTTPAWNNVFAHLLTGRQDKFQNVHFGHDGTKCAIYIGNADSTWSYPQIQVMDFHAGFSNATVGRWSSGWDIGFTPTLGNNIKSTVAQSEVSWSDQVDVNTSTSTSQHNLTFHSGDTIYGSNGKLKIIPSTGHLETLGGLKLSGGNIEFQHGARQHITFKDAAGNAEGYIYKDPDVSGIIVIGTHLDVTSGLKQDGNVILNGTDTWLRTTGDTGWYSSTYAGGIYMTDTTWIRTYGSKKFYVDNIENDAIKTAGGVYSTKKIYGNADLHINSTSQLDGSVTIGTTTEDSNLTIFGKLSVGGVDIVNTSGTLLVNAPSATKLATSRTISLSGDVSGSVSFNGTSAVNIVTTIADDSHNHTIANVDGLQTALNGKLGSTAKAADSEKLDGRDGSDYMQAHSDGTYEGLGVNGNTTNWIRTTVNGFIPNTSGGASALGTSSWPFGTIYGNTIYEGGTSLSSKYQAKGSYVTTNSAQALNVTTPISVSNDTITLHLANGTSSSVSISDANTWRPIQNVLTSTSTTESLSAAQGKWLNDNKLGKTEKAASATTADACSGNAATATWSDTVDVNSANTSASWYDVVWHSEDTLYSSTGVEIQGSTNTLRAGNLSASGDVYAGGQSSGDYFYSHSAAGSSWDHNSHGGLLVNASSASSAYNILRVNTDNGFKLQTLGGTGGTQRWYTNNSNYITFSGTTITASLSGNASSATTAASCSGNSATATWADTVDVNTSTSTSFFNVNWHSGDTLYSANNTDWMGYRPSDGFSKLRHGYLGGNRIVHDTSGRLVAHNTAGRRAGMYGVYDSTKTAHIWSMGTAYVIPDDGSTFGNLYGLAYKHTNNTTGGTMASGHQMVWCQNGTGYAALGDNIWAKNNVIAYSDERVKTNFERIENALDKVCSINGYTYDRTDVETPRQAGFKAQDIQKILPEVVVEGTNEGDHLSLAYGNMGALYVEAIKELKEENDSLKERLAKLEEIVNNLI